MCAHGAGGSVAKNFVLIRCNLHETAEVLGMSATLGIPPAHVVGCLCRVWGWARDEMDETGTVRVPVGMIDALAAVPGLAAAMQEQRWLSADDASVTFPHPQRWITRDAVKRAQTRERADRKRARDALQSAHETRTKRAPEREEKREREEEDNGCAVAAGASAAAAAEPDYSPDLRAGAAKRIASLTGRPASQIPGTLVTEVVAYTAGHPARKHDAAAWPDDADEPMDRARMIRAAFDVAEAEAQSKTPHGVVGFVVGVMEQAILAGEYPEPRGPVRSLYADQARERVEF